MGGAFAAVKVASFDLVGVLALGSVSALGGGLLRDVLIGVTPPAAFSNLPFLIAAALGSLIPMFLAQPGRVLRRTITFIDAMALGLYCAVGAEVALLHHLEPLPTVIVGTISGVGGGVLRDLMVNRIPAVFRADFYALPAAAGSLMVIGTYAVGLQNTVVPSIAGATFCFLLRLAGVMWKLEVPKAAGPHDDIGESGGRQDREG